MTCTNSTSADSSFYPLIADSSQVTDQIRKRCAKQQNCEVQASSPFFESVPSASKYLKVWHECIPDVSGVILPSRRKRDTKIQQNDLSTKSTGPEPFKAYSDGLETSASRNSSSKGVEQNVFGGKSNEQISSIKNESTGRKEKRNEPSYGNTHLASALDDMLGAVFPL